jgi:hypothetical protein
MKRRNEKLKAVRGCFFVVFGISVNFPIDKVFQYYCTFLFFETPMLHAQQVMLQPLKVNLSQ